MKNRFQNAFPTYKYYKNFIANVLQENSLPLSLQYLPFLESLYDPIVVSRAKAVGTWQLMASAAIENGLRVDYGKFTYAKNKKGRLVRKALPAIIDERRDPIKATHAAAKYFLNAYDKIREAACAAGFVYDVIKSSCVVVTSYNHGVNGMSRAVEQFGLDYIAIRLNYKSKLFGPDGKGYFVKFLAFTHVASNQVEYFGYEIPPMNVPETKTITLHQSTTAAAVASKYDVPLNVLKYLNLKYTEEIWRGKYKIPANYTVEIPVTPNVTTINFSKF